MDTKECQPRPGYSPETTDRINARLQLRLRPGKRYQCPLISPFSTNWDQEGGSENPVDEEIRDIGFTKRENECLVHFVLANGNVVSSSGTAPNSSCLCDAFQEFDCVPQFTGIEDGWIHVTTHVERRDQIRPLIADLNAIVEAVVIDRLVVTESNDDDDLVLCDRSMLTEKQREAIELAVTRGYYTQRSDVGLAELADELGISQSALSERLRTAQSKLVTDLF